MKARAIAALGLAAFVGAGSAAAQDLESRSRRLEQELRLAKTSAAYLVVDAAAGTISLKMRGMALKTWQVAEMTAWGRPVGLAVLKVERRSGWSAQDRVNLTPGKKKDEKSVPQKPRDIGEDVMELADMPIRYRFLMEKGVRMMIRPKPAGLLAGSLNAIAGIGRSAGRSVRLIGAAITGQNVSDLRVIVREPKDAQAIFWSVPEGTAVLFL